MNIYFSVHGNWTSWSSWSLCSTSCGSGEIKRIRACTNPPPDLDGGMNCTGDDTEAMKCNENLACPGMMVYLILFPLKFVHYML